MSSTNTDPTSKNTEANSSVNNYINPNTEVRLAYYTYTWDESGFTKQRTAWSSIGSYYYDSSSGDITYTSNKNQLIKTAGSSGVAVVDNTLGVIANTENDVVPIILRADGTYIAGLDNVNIRIGNQYLHTYLNEIDLHFIETFTDLNTHSIKYTDLWGQTTLNSSYSQLKNVDSEEWVSTTLSSRGTVVENTHVVLVGEKGGLNRIENTGFIYNDLTYSRRFNVIDIWMGFYDIVGNWKYDGSSFKIINSYSGTIGDDNTTSTIQFESTSNNDGLITAVNDGTIASLGIYTQQFKYLRDCYTDSNYEKTNYADTYEEVVSSITSITNAIETLLGNGNEYENRLEAPLSKEIFTSASNVLAMYADVSNVGDVYLSQKSAIVVNRIPWNSTFIDINTTNTATAFAVINDRTKTWNKIDFPTIDETWVKIIDSITDVQDGNPYYHYDKLINQFPLRRATADNFSNVEYIHYYNSAGETPTVNSANSNSYQLLVDGSIPTSMSYYISDNNITNSANNYRFIGLKTQSIYTDGNKDYSNSEASNIIQITGFNKILLSDLYENPNNYQIPSVEYYWGSTNTGVNSGSSFNVEDIPVNEGISYSMSIKSALNVDGNFLVAGVGQSSEGSGARTGYNGVFYIPLPTGIDQNEDSQYHDTHWMLTTYTPQANNNATSINLPNSGQVLYKYTKMNDLITTGVFGGFTPYYTTKKLTAGLVNIPQVSYNSNAYVINNIVYASSSENQVAKISKLVSDIAYLVPAFNTTNTIFNNSFEAQITSNSDKCCIITLNSYEAKIIDTHSWMENIDSNDKPIIRNVMYLNLFGYDDGEWNNLSFNVDRKYIFTFNCHIQATNLNLMSDQINYGTPSLLLVGHFRKHYCKSSINTATENQIYAGETQLIPLLNKPLENPVNNIYNIEGTYTLSWNTTGTETNKAMINNYSFYIPEEYRKPFSVPNGSTFYDIYTTVFKDSQIWGNGGNDIDLYTPLNSNNDNLFTTYSDGAYLVGNHIEFLNVLDRIYAFILVGPNVNPNVRYQFVNNTTYQNSSTKILAETDLELFAGITIDENANGDKSINTSQFNVNEDLGIDGGILGINEPMFSMTIQRY